MDDINIESADTGTLVFLAVDAGLRRQGEPILSSAFQGRVDAETLMAVQELLRKGEVL